MAGRQITNEIESAFKRGQSKKIGNTRTDGKSVWLHDNLIITTDKLGFLWFTLSGWPTPTTRERLSIAGVNVYQRKGDQYWRDPKSPIDSNRWYRCDGKFEAESINEIER